MTGGIKLLTQAEVAAVLRRDVKAVQRLRERGELGYLPGRPVMIPQNELDAYLERKMVKRQVVEPISPESPTSSIQLPLAAAPVGARRTPEEQADYMIARMKRDGSLEGLLKLQREVAEQERRRAMRSNGKATSGRPVQGKTSVRKAK